jgi:hypothetical protein
VAIDSTTKNCFVVAQEIFVNAQMFRTMFEKFSYQLSVTIVRD